MDPINLFDFEALAVERVAPLAWEYFVSGVEDEYGVALKGDDVGKIKTVGDAIELVVRKGS